MKLVLALLAALPLAASGQQEPARPAAPPAAGPAAPAAATAEARPEGRRRTRAGWYMGFGLGIADGWLTRDGTRNSFRELVGPDPTRLALHAGMGATLTPRLLLGAEVSLAGASDHTTDPSIGKLTRSVSVTSLDAVATFFPVAEGFFFRAGGGLSRLSLRTDGGVHLRETRGGFNLLGGVGYAFWVGQRFSVSLNLDGSRQWYRGATAPSRTSIWALYAGVGWY